MALECTETMRHLESFPTEAGAHTIGFDAGRPPRVVYAFFPKTHRAAICRDSAASGSGRS
jgi:hypothetical protein